MENSLHYLGESLNHVMQFQQNVNRNMVEHLNMTAKNQLLQGQTEIYEIPKWIYFGFITIYIGFMARIHFLP